LSIRAESGELGDPPITLGISALNNLGELVRSDKKELQTYHKVPYRRTVRWYVSTYSHLPPGHKADGHFKSNGFVVQHTDNVVEPTLPLYPLPSMLRYRAPKQSRTVQTGLSPLAGGLWRDSFPSDIAGQFIRIGGATTDVPSDQIQAPGRRSSEAYRHPHCPSPMFDPSLQYFYSAWRQLRGSCNSATCTKVEDFEACEFQWFLKRDYDFPPRYFQRLDATYWNETELSTSGCVFLV
jgi:hypothetical protein